MSNDIDQYYSKDHTYDKLPRELKIGTNWLISDSDGVPWRSYLHKADGTQTNNGLCYKNALSLVTGNESYAHQYGLSLMVGPVSNTHMTVYLVGIDLDHVIKDGKVAYPLVQKILDIMKTAYIEYSPSKEGFHIFAYCQKHPPFLPCKVLQLGDDKEKIEIYTEKKVLRMTGWTTNEDTCNLRALHDTEFRQVLETVWPAVDFDKTEEFDYEMCDWDNEPQRCIAKPAQIIRRINASSLREKFHRLFVVGDTSDYGFDESAAEMGLACMLAFWCCHDKKLIEYIMSKAAICQREKWLTRDDYRILTINNAIKLTPTIFKRYAMYVNEDDSGEEVNK